MTAGTTRAPARGRDAPASLEPRAYEAAFVLSTEPAAFLDAEGVVVAANGALASLLGRDADHVVGRPLASLAAPTALDALAAFLRRALAWHEAEGEVAFVRADGTRAAVDLSARLFVTEAGERLLQLSARDARERRRRDRPHRLALAASRASNGAATRPALARAIIDSLRPALLEAERLAVFGHDPERGVLEVLATHGLDDAWARTSGVQRVGGDGPETLLAHAARAGESVLVLDARLEPPPNPTTLPAEAASVAAVPVHCDEGLLGGILVGSGADRHLDLDDLRLVEIAAAELASGLLRLDAAERLAVADIRYRAVVADVSDGIVIVAPEGRVLEANPAARRLLDWRGGELPARLADTLPALDEVARAAAERGASTAYVERGPAEDGSPRHLRLRASFAEGPPPRVVLVVEDATAETRAREREREALLRVRRMHEELSEFLLWTTHDLREPLRSLATLASILRDEVPGDGEAHVLATAIESAAGTLKDRVLALHEFSVSTREEGRPVEQDADAVLQRVLAQHAALVESRRASVEVERPLPRVRALRGRLEIVLANLLENALKYADVEAPRVRVSGRRLGERVELVVEDNGPGVPPDLREHVFRPFYRSPAHRALPGTGLGLAMVQRIASQHGGGVRIEDAEGGGARLVVSLPA